MSEDTASSDHSLRSKAWVYYDQGALIETLQQSTLPVNTRLGSNEVIVQVKAVALNPVDIQVANLPQWIANWLLFSGSHKAKVPAGDFSGVIYQIGDKVTKYKVGDEVFGLNLSIIGHGCLSEYIVVSETLSSMILKPTYLSHVEAAAIPLAFLTAYTALHQWAGYTETDSNHQKVLILGASGGVGHIACQIARAMNKYVVGTCSSSNVTFVKEMGANEVIDYTTEDLVSASRQHGPYDFIFDCVGGTQLIPSLNLDLLTPQSSGYITIVGDKTARDILGGIASYLFTPAMIFRSLKSLIGLGPRYYCINLSTSTENTEQMFRMLNQKKVKPIIDSVFAFSGDVRRAYERLNTGRVKGKIVIDFEK